MNYRGFSFFSLTRNQMESHCVVLERIVFVKIQLIFKNSIIHLLFLLKTRNQIQPQLFPRHKKVCSKETIKRPEVNLVALNGDSLSSAAALVKRHDAVAALHNQRVLSLSCLRQLNCSFWVSSRWFLFYLVQYLFRPSRIRIRIFSQLKQRNQ